MHPSDNGLRLIDLGAVPVPGISLVGAYAHFAPPRKYFKLSHYRQNSYTETKVGAWNTILTGC